LPRSNAPTESEPQTMTIHELANACHAEKVELPNDPTFTWKSFPPEKSDVLVGDNGALVIGINRETGRFAAQRGSVRVFGDVETDIAATAISQLRGSMT
jgi:hypothetical protein